MPMNNLLEYNNLLEMIIGMKKIMMEMKIILLVITKQTTRQVNFLSINKK